MHKAAITAKKQVKLVGCDLRLAAAGCGGVADVTWAIAAISIISTADITILSSASTPAPAAASELHPSHPLYVH